MSSLLNRFDDFSFFSVNTLLSLLLMLGIGIDLVFIPRITRIFNKYGIRFAKKFLHPQELKVFEMYKHRKNQEYFLASR
jgi:phosphopantetheinyl transferase (holo-ACP synthase)